jgi:hypothetical protein
VSYWQGGQEDHVEEEGEAYGEEGIDGALIGPQQGLYEGLHETSRGLETDRDGHVRATLTARIALRAPTYRRPGEKDP